MKIELKVKDKMDAALLLSGINVMRNGAITKAHNIVTLPKNFKSKKLIDELVDDWDRLNSLGTQLSNIIEEKNE